MKLSYAEDFRITAFLLCFVLVAHMSKHMKFKWLREVESVDFTKMLINFRKMATVALFLLYM